MASMRFHPFGLFGLLSVLSTLSAAENLKMHTIRGLMTTCGDNVVLRCNVTTDGTLDITEFSWKDSKDICNWGQPTNRTDMQCMTATSTNSYNYSLTIYNIQPKHTGAYHCQLHSKQGSRNGKTFVQVHKCVGKSTVRVNSTDGTCIFEDVFPRSGVSWKQGNDDSISHLATTTVTENEKGLFTVVSTMRLRKDPSYSSVYTCSLWMHVRIDMFYPAVAAVRTLTFSRAESLIVHWFGVMIAMVLLWFNQSQSVFLAPIA